MRSRWLRRLIALLFVVGGMACQVDVVAMISESDLKVEQNEVSGTYVFNQRETRDELVLRDDGTFQRSAVYRGIRQAQAGTWRLWNMREETASRIEFDATTPKCLKSTRSPDALLVWREPNDFICGGHVPYFCREWGRPDLLRRRCARLFPQAAIAWVLPRFCAQVKAAAHFVEEITTDIASFTARDDQPDESLSPNPSREVGPHQIRAGSRLALGARLASSNLRSGT